MAQRTVSQIAEAFLCELFERPTEASEREGKKTIIEKYTDQQLSTSPVNYQSDDVTMTSYLVKPERASNAPEIIVIQEWWGMNDHIKDVARRLARQDYIAPDLYSRLGNAITTDAGLDTILI